MGRRRGRGKGRGQGGRGGKRAGLRSRARGGRRYIGTNSQLSDSRLVAFQCCAGCMQALSKAAGSDAQFMCPAALSNSLHA